MTNEQDYVYILETNQPNVIKRRNREKTTNRILIAVGEALAKGGVEKAGINAIASQAGVNKVLIYRYFGSWNGLIEAFYEKIFSDINAQTDVIKSETAPAEPATIAEQYVIHYYRTLQANPAWQYLIRWQMDNKLTELAQRLAALQEQSLQQLRSEDVLETGVIRMLIAGLTHSALVATKADSSDTLDLTEQVISRILRPTNVASLLLPDALV